MITDGGEDLRIDGDPEASVAAQRPAVSESLQPDRRSAAVDPTTAPFFVRIHSSVQAPSAPADVEPQPAPGQTVWTDRDFRAGLRAAGLDDVAAVMASGEGHCLRALADRENWRLQLARPEGESRGLFLKKHHVRTWASRLQAFFRMAPGPTAGRVEAGYVARLKEIGIQSMRVVAWGERLHRNGRVESYLMTEELKGYLPLEQFLDERFGPAATRGETRKRDLRRLIRVVADVARQFHQAGYNHRDFYCCHFFIKESPSGRFDVRMIDLQRVQHRVRFRRRWLVKDLAQLSFSASRRFVTRTDRTAFIRRYLGVKKLRPRDKRLIRRVLAKQRLMEWKLGVVE